MSRHPKRLIWVALIVVMLLFSGTTAWKFHTVGGIAVPSDTTRVTAQLPERGDSTRQIVMIIRCYDDDSCEVEHVNQPTATPWPTFTPTATVFTPPPTFTQIPSVTPIHSSVTPTQEDTRTPKPPTPTITPTATATPLQAVCWGQVTADTLNVRDKPWGAILGQVEQGQYLAFEAKQKDEFDNWWYRIYWLPDQPGFLDGSYVHLGWIQIDLDADCDDLPDETPQVSRLLDGLHMLVGAQEQTLNWIDHYGTLKGLTHSDKLPLLAKQINPEIVIVYRSLFNANGQIDGPTPDEWLKPDLYWSKLRDYLVPGFDYYEFINEWGPPSRKIEADFNIAILDLMAQDGLCGLAFSPGPGNPEIPAWDEWVRTLHWIDDHPCGTWPDGRTKYHGLAIHQAGKLPEWVETLPDNYSKNPWIYARIEAVDIYLKLTHDYDLHDFKGPIYVTEMGFEDYTIPNEEFTCEEVRAGLGETRGMYVETGLIDGWHLWNFQGADMWFWVDLTRCLPVIYG